MSSRDIDRALSEWTSESGVNVWELSGQHEGDIMFDGEVGGRGAGNVVRFEAAQWRGAVVPYHFQAGHFTRKERKVIRGAMKEYHEKTCLRFRPYRSSDHDYVVFRGDGPGCWSYVGKMADGQVLNLRGDSCLRHGLVVHEIMHALGFFHQQSAPERDHFITIHWQNIRQGRARDFEKLDASIVTNYGVLYDYESVMHYSSHAFSKNGKPTITPLDRDAAIGQREGLSERDVVKLNIMYKCVRPASRHLDSFNK